MSDDYEASCARAAMWTDLQWTQWERGKLFFESACRSVTRNTEQLWECEQEDLEAALVYAKSQLWLGRRGKKITRCIEGQLKSRA